MDTLWVPFLIHNLFTIPIWQKAIAILGHCSLSLRINKLIFLCFYTILWPLCTGAYNAVTYLSASNLSCFKHILFAIKYKVDWVWLNCDLNPLRELKLCIVTVAYHEK